MQLELWLDESGDFVSDHKDYLNPSLVGGVLVEKGDITEESARQMIGKDYVHFNQEGGHENMALLEAIKEKHGELVIFQNKERVKIIDGDTTYLNVLAEGIIQLLLRLSAMYGDFELDILIATRKNMEKGYGIIEEQEYEERLRERIIVGLARKVLTRKNKWKYDVHFGDARKSSRLMLADGVCNTYLTRTSSKFTSEQKDRIEELYQNQFIFSFFENSPRQDIERRLAEGDISEVIFECFLESNKEFKEPYLSIALEQLQELDEYGQRIQLRNISSEIETFIKIERNYHFIRPVLIAMQEELLPKLKEFDIEMPEFHLDIILYLYSLYTREGSMKANEQDRLFMEQLALVKDIMVKFEYYNLYKLRRAIHQKNLMDIHGSIADSTKAISILEEMVQLLDLLEDEALDTDEPDMYETLGKAYGTRGQGYAMLIHQDKQNLEKAIDDYDQALKHFTIDVDEERQYLYKAQAYSEGEEFEKAISCLFQASEVDQNAGLEGLLRTFKEEEVPREIYKYFTYYKIMAASKVSGNDALADKMYEALNQENISVDELGANYRSIHPMQFIYWNMAIYLFKKGKDKLANTYLNNGIERCDSQYSGVTIKVIQLGMYAEKLRITMEKGNNQQIEHVKNELHGRFNTLKKAPNARFIFEYLQEIDETQLDDIEKVEQLIRLTRCIN
ncbi:hypothetical protein [Ornithinibacillus halophilus]|uniref:Tetratricopeptide repeat-containing protein n=1 Tax=Ornithinibacillus halophilus TaxID=930117 RepID=A0A1M5JZK0_9BACI|nr:hypothetical protein [Ornithinibacillus halophilus]SHG45938.1 hypothetical protein SAMN05216225_103434 [Ornithinibacillus halophilus]